MYTNSERLDTVVAMLTPEERSDLARAVNDWREDRDIPDSLGLLRDALLRHASDQTDPSLAAISDELTR